MTSPRHTPSSAETIIEYPGDFASPPQSSGQDRNGKATDSARTLADDLGGEPDENTGDTQKPAAKAETPGEYLIHLRPKLAEAYGVPLIETFVGRDEDDLRLRIEALEEEFFARYLGFEGSPTSPAVFDHSTKKFFAYEDGRYVEITAENLAGKVRELLLRAERACTDPRLERKALVRLRGQRSLGAIMKAAQGSLLVRDDFWDRPNEVIPCQNGLLTWTDDDGLVLMPHSPQYHFRGLLGASYDAQAKCPRFIKFLNRALPSDDVELLKRYVGNVIFGQNIAQKLLILMGTPQSGKGVFARILTSLIGAENVTTLRTNTLESRFEIGRCVGKLLLYGPDVSARFLHESGAHMLKAITGEDPFSPEYKGSNVTPPAKPLTANILVTCNSRLKVHLEGDRGAYERRLVVIPFDSDGVSEEQQITGLSNVLMREESSGILNWALEGLCEFLHDDLKLILNDRQKTIVSDLLDESESCSCFLRECIRPKRGGKLLASQAYRNYVDFCSSRQWPPSAEVKFNRDFKKAVQEKHGVTQSNDLLGGRGWRGIGVIDDDAEVGEV